MHFINNPTFFLWLISIGFASLLYSFELSAISIMTEIKTSCSTPLMVRKYKEIENSPREMANIKISYFLGLCSKENNYANFSRILSNGQISEGTTNHLNLKNVKLQSPDEKFAVMGEISDIRTRDMLFTHWENGVRIDRGKIFYLFYQEDGLQEEDTITFYTEPYKPKYQHTNILY